MEGGRSVFGAIVGFFFWLGIAWYFYHRDFAGAFRLVLAGCALYGLWLLISRLRSARGRRPRTGEEAGAPPASDFPDYDFENVKPKDFE